VDLPDLRDLSERVAVLESTVAEIAKRQATQPLDLVSLMGKCRSIAADAHRLISPVESPLAENERTLLLILTDPLARTRVQMVNLSMLLEEEVEPLAGLAAAAAHPVRAHILRLLSQREMGPTEIGEAVGLEGGPLYHHLNELMAARVIHQPARARYRISSMGLQLFMTLASACRAGRKDSSHTGEETLEND